MQNKDKKPSSKVKKYGEPYERKHLLRRGDMRLIAKVTGFAYITVVQQLDGTRSISPQVKAMADKLADTNKKLIDAIDQINSDSDSDQ